MNFEDKRFCVYLHLRKDNGIPFYVGQGTGRRPWTAFGRSKRWRDINAEAGGFDVKVLESNIDKEQALELEEFLIKELDGYIVNSQHSSSTVKDMLYDKFNSRYYIDDSSPSGLRYKIDVYAHSKNGKNYSILSRVGDVAGNKGQDGWQICYNKKNYRVHRIVYLLKYGTIDNNLVVDHIDGNNLNNNIENLRLITQSENVRNRSIDKRNTSGVTGVSIFKNGTVKASITIYGKRFQKSFSSKSLSLGEAIRLASEWREQMLEKSKNVGFEYSTRHGS